MLPISANVQLQKPLSPVGEYLVPIGFGTVEYGKSQTHGKGQSTGNTKNN